MTDQPRVEAVARAIDQTGCWDTYDELMQAGGYFASDSLLERLERSKATAQAAIEASDAWVLAKAGVGHKPGASAILGDNIIVLEDKGTRLHVVGDRAEVTFTQSAPSPEETDK